MPDRIQNPYKSKAIPTFLYLAAEDPENAYISGISNNYGYDVSAVSKYLKTLEDIDFVETEEIGQRTYYRVEEENIIEIVRKIIEHTKYIPHNVEHAESWGTDTTQEQVIEFAEEHEPFRKYLYAAFLSVISTVIWEIDEDEETGEINHKPTIPGKDSFNFETIADETLRLTKSAFRQAYEELEEEGREIPEEYEEIKNVFEIDVEGEEDYGIRGLTNRFLGVYGFPSTRLEIPKPAENVLVGMSNPPLTDYVEIKDVPDSVIRRYREHLSIGPDKGLNPLYLKILEHISEEETVSEEEEAVWAYIVRNRYDGPFKADALYDFVENKARFGYFENEEEAEELLEHFRDLGLLWKAVEGRDYSVEERDDGFRITVESPDNTEDAETGLSEEEALDKLNQIKTVEYWPNFITDEIVDAVKERSEILQFKNEVSIYNKDGFRKEMSAEKLITTLLERNQHVFVCPQDLVYIFNREEARIKRGLEELERNEVLTSEEVFCSVADESEEHKHYRFNSDRLVTLEVTTLSFSFDADLSGFNRYDVLRNKTMKESLPEKGEEKRDELLTEINQVKYSCDNCGNEWNTEELMEAVYESDYSDAIQPESLEKKQILIRIIRNVESNPDYFEQVMCPVCDDARETPRHELDVERVGSISDERLRELKERFGEITDKIKDESEI